MSLASSAVRSAFVPFCLALVSGATLPALAATTVVPQSALTASGQFYTDLIGGGIGSVVVMTGGGSAAGIGDPSGRNDDGFSGPIGLGYTLSFFGGQYTQFFANNNGNISFGGGISEYTPTGPTGVNAPLISVWFGDVDTRGAASGVLHLRNDVANQTILTWDRVGYFNAMDDRLDSFQMVIRGPGYAIPAGEGQIGFFYKAMPWEVTATSRTAAVGFGNGQGDSVILQGSNTPGLNAVVENHFIWFNQNLEAVPVVTAIPEPETYALMMMGLATVGAIARRRRRASGHH